jgi:hypothetical protein
VTFRKDDQNAEKPTFYDGIQLIQSHLYATTGFTYQSCHSRVNGNPEKGFVIKIWIPAFAGMTNKKGR